MLGEIDEGRPQLSTGVQEQVNINIKYEGYIKRQLKQVSQFKKLESKKYRKILITKISVGFVSKQNRN